MKASQAQRCPSTFTAGFSVPDGVFCVDVLWRSRTLLALVPTAQTLLPAQVTLLLSVRFHFPCLPAGLLPFLLACLCPRRGLVRTAGTLAVGQPVREEGPSAVTILLQTALAHPVLFLTHTGPHGPPVRPRQPQHGLLGKVEGLLLAEVADEPQLGKVVPPSAPEPCANAAGKRDSIRLDGVAPFGFLMACGSYLYSYLYFTPYGRVL